MAPTQSPEHPTSAPARASRPEWLAAMRAFERPSLRRALWQMLDTFLPYGALWALMVLLVRQGAPYGLVLLLSVLAAGFQVRIFILFHDCCHGSFFRSRRANSVLGTLAGVLTFTPFREWRLAHNAHHATVADLDRRGIGDVTTLTVEEYRAAPLLRRLRYRAYRHPLVLFVLGPVWLFLLSFRFFPKGAKAPERRSVLVTNLALAALALVSSWTIGLKTYLLIQLPVLLIGGAFGIWLFYVQHQFERGYWAAHPAWDPVEASLKGSSYYKLPKVLQWFSGNIGLHHVHHLRPRIPNYNLQRCLESLPALRDVEPLTFWKSLRTLRLRLWDERESRMVGFAALSKLPAS
ncbi:MAG: fatty acid desaturase [Acidobacteriota bacterium]